MKNYVFKIRDCYLWPTRYLWKHMCGKRQIFLFWSFWGWGGGVNFIILMINFRISKRGGRILLYYLGSRMGRIFFFEGGGWIFKKRFRLCPTHYHKYQMSHPLFKLGWGNWYLKFDIHCRSRRGCDLAKEQTGGYCWR